MQRKVNRLPKSNYNISNVYYLTICCHNRSKYFITDSIVNLCLENIKQLIVRFKAKLWVYCFMPDHVHMLVETENCADLIKLFKQITAYEYKQISGGNLWQKSYYDHILRNDEDLIEAMTYVLDNPVRAKLVNSYLDYPYLGSFEFNIKDFLET